jgi:hypothetical protein
MVRIARLNFNKLLHKGLIFLILLSFKVNQIRWAHVKGLRYLRKEAGHGEQHQPRAQPYAPPLGTESAAGPREGERSDEADAGLHELHQIE